MSDVTQELSPVKDNKQASAVSPMRPWYRRRVSQVIAACAVAAVGLSAGGVQISRAHTASVVADLTTQIESEAQAFEAAWHALRIASQDAIRIYLESEGHVTDETTRQAIADLLATNDAQITPVLEQAPNVVPTSMIPTLADGANVDEARRTLEEATSSTRAMTQYTTQLTNATAALRESVAAFERQ